MCGTWCEGKERQTRRPDPRDVPALPTPDSQYMAAPASRLSSLGFICESEISMSVPQPLPVQAHLDAEASDAKELDEDGKVVTDLGRGHHVGGVETGERSLNESQERLVAPDQFEERYRTSKYERWAYYSYYIGAFGAFPSLPLRCSCR